MPVRAPLLLAALLLTVSCRQKDDPVDTAPAEDVDQDADGYAAPADCDDADPAINPGAEEACDGLDNNCDGSIDEGVLLSFYTDADGDGYGADGSELQACELPVGGSEVGGDCDDADPSAWPGAGEQCDGVDNDCDGAVDEEVVSTWYADTDSDGFGDPAVALEDCDPPSGYVSDDTDCDDSDPSAWPGGAEVCDGADNDCDGQVDNDAINPDTFYADADADGYGDPATSVEACEAPEGYTADSEDCDDADPAVNPAATEVCNGVDDDCDSEVDPASSADASVWYIDYDGDGYGDASYTVTRCDPPNGYVADATDCHDTTATTYPGADEYCDGVDSDCDGVVDEASALDALTWYADADADGYGDPNATTPACSQPSGYLADDSDCHDSDPSAYPGSTSTETPGDGIDQDCDGLDACTDLNCDGLPDMVVGNHYDGDYFTESHLYFNQGSGFTDADRAALPTVGNYDVDVTDFDGDGYQDALFTNYYNGSTRVLDSTLYWGSASGYSTADSSDLPTVGALDALVEDLDGDGFVDIVFSNYFNNSTYAVNSYLYWGSASGYSTADRDALLTYGARDAAAEDLNGDGYTDLVFCNYYNGSYSTNSRIYWGGASGYSTSSVTDLPTLGCFDVAIEDFNGDGAPDIAFANHYGGDYNVNSYVYYNNSGSFSTAYRDDLPTQGAVALAAGDVDNDGLPDLVFSGYHNNGWGNEAYTRVFANSSLGFSASVRTDLAGRGAWGVQLEDLDSDGWLDLLVPGYYSGSSYANDSSVYWGGSAGYSTADRTALPGLGASWITAGDLDGDGSPELVLNNYYTGSSYAASTYVYGGPARGYSSANVTSLSTWASWAPVVLVGDSSW